MRSKLSGPLIQNAVVVVPVISGELRFKRECVKRAITFVVVLKGNAFINYFGAVLRWILAAGDSREGEAASEELQRQRRGG